MQAALLVLTVLLPPAGVILAVKLIASRISKSQVPLKNLFTLNPEKGAMEQTLLWVCLLVPVGYFLTTGLISWHPYNLSMTAVGFNKFIEISKLPLGLLSLSIPLTMLALRLHSTQQTALQIAKTKRQIEITEKKNNIDAFYAHRKALIEYFEKIGPTTYEGDIKVTFTAHPRLHIKFFKNTRPEDGIPELNTKYLEKTIRKLRHARLYIAIALNDMRITRDPQTGKTVETARESNLLKNKARALAYAKACNLIFEIADILVTPEIYSTLKGKEKKSDLNCIINRPKTVSYHPIGSTEEMLGAYRYLRSFTRLLCEFSGHPVNFFSTNTIHGHIDGKSEHIGIISKTKVGGIKHSAPHYSKEYWAQMDANKDGRPLPA